MIYSARRRGSPHIVTHRKRAEDALAQQSVELARSNSDLQKFAATTSHDLKEPLRAITIFSQMINERCGAQLDADGTRFLGHIVSAAKRMEDLIGSLLEYSCAIGAEASPFGPVAL
jgi:chemotaxis family two-component system sensor kinase Cph1